MARFNTMLAVLAAAGLTLAQPAAAATRTAAPVGESESLSDVPPGSAAVIGLIGLLGFVFIIMAITEDGDDDFPSSP